MIRLLGENKEFDKLLLEPVSIRAQRRMFRMANKKTHGPSVLQDLVRPSPTPTFSGAFAEGSRFAPHRRRRTTLPCRSRRTKRIARLQSLPPLERRTARSGQGKERRSGSESAAVVSRFHGSSVRGLFDQLPLLLLHSDANVRSCSLRAAARTAGLAKGKPSHLGHAWLPAGSGISVGTEKASALKQKRARNKLIAWRAIICF